MPKRIAITVAGAVSLGSYEAGVIYELLQAIRTNNEKAASEDSKIYIDVLTGASAGGMTAAMVSQRLMYDAASLEGETTNALYQAWVERISLLGLARMHRKERKWHSLFSSDLIDSIGEIMLIRSMEDEGSGPHAAVEQVGGVPETLRVGLALTNLGGIDYMIPILGNDDGGFNYTSSLDQKLFEVKPGTRTDTAMWKVMCKASVGSGAFPVAFRPKAVEHACEEYGERLPADKKLWQQGKTYVDWTYPKSPAEFAHSDGGVLQNQPLGIAKHLVDIAVADREVRLGQAAHCDSADRLYVFVSPNSVKSSTQHLRAARITIWAELKHLFRVYTRQATFHDWITAEAMNQQIRVLDTRAEELAAVIMQGEVDLAALAKASSDLNAMLMPNKESDRLARLRKQYSGKFNEVLTSSGPQAADAFISAIATLEAAAHLENRDKMKIVAVIADSQKELAGAGLAAFVGFFKKSFREHDYWVGRVKTRVYLQRTDVKKILGVTKWPKEDEWQVPLPNPTKVKLPLSKFQVLRAAFVPLVVMVVIRPALLLLIGVLTVALAWGVWHLVHRLLMGLH
jgi:Patatin-like phospholipase